MTALFLFGVSVFSFVMSFALLKTQPPDLTAEFEKDPSLRRIYESNLRRARFGGWMLIPFGTWFFILGVKQIVT